MQETIISIIIPIYNVEQYLHQCLNSVISQATNNYICPENVEILLIDDGSTDNSGKICDTYSKRDKRIRVFHTANNGLSAARNLGIDHSKGIYIAFIDSDDWYELDAVCKMTEAAVKTNASVICFQYTIESDFCSKRRRHDPVNAEQITIVGDDIIQELYLGPIKPFVWNKLYKKELFSEIRFPKGRLYEDIATTYQLLLQAREVVCIPYELIHYRLRDDSISNTHNLKNLSDHWWACKRCYEDLNEISEVYGNLQLGMCSYSIGRMWRWYFGLTKEEKDRANDLLDTMQRFAKDHRGEVLRSSHISMYNKMLCLCSVIRNERFMKLLYTVNRIFRKFHNPHC